MLGVVTSKFGYIRSAPRETSRRSINQIGQSAQYIASKGTRKDAAVVLSEIVNVHTRKVVLIPNYPGESNKVTRISRELNKPCSTLSE